MAASAEFAAILRHAPPKRVYARLRRAMGRGSGWGPACTGTLPASPL